MAPPVPTPAGFVPAQGGFVPAQGAFAAVLSLFGSAVLIQVYPAGDAALIAPAMWTRHVAWIHAFQWISLVLPLAGFWARPRWGFALPCCLPMAVLGLRYRLIHAAVNGGEAGYAGLQAVGGALMFGILVFIGQEWRHGARP